MKVTQTTLFNVFVLGDGQEIYKSPFMEPKDAAKKISISIKPYSGISLVAIPNGEDIWKYGAVWANPIFIKLIPERNMQPRRERTQPRVEPRTVPRQSTQTAITNQVDQMIVDLRSNPISVSINGSALNFGFVRPVSQGGRVLVPMRDVFEALGAMVDYNAATRTILAERGSTGLQMTIGSRTAFVSGRPVTMDVPAQTALGRTLVPLRFVAEAFGVNVTVWQ